MRVLVGGGTEFIGLHVVQAPRRDGHEVTVLNRAVYTTGKIRAQLGIRPRFTLASGLAHTLDWYLREGLDKRDVDFSHDDALLRH